MWCIDMTFTAHGMFNLSNDQANMIVSAILTSLGSDDFYSLNSGIYTDMAAVVNGTWGTYTLNITAGDPMQIDVYDQNNADALQSAAALAGNQYTSLVASTASTSGGVGDFLTSLTKNIGTLVIGGLLIYIFLKSEK
jgi:hypothetical protein